MSTDFKHFPKIFSEVVSEVRNEYDPTNQLQPYFEYGTYFELMEACKIKDDNQVENYPLIYLVWERGENEKKWIDPCIYTISARVFICALAERDDTSDDRYTNTIEPILYPIFDTLLSELGYHGNIELNSDFTHQVTDHPFWTNTDGTFDDLSAIEIRLENLLMLKS
ncbi:MAG: hypothetical protein JZU49_04835 [Sulfuricurvum sp.]|jgi:hypothetical protein|nr:hypothetical protein [Sulfuricurvum sp.]